MKAIIQGREIIFDDEDYELILHCHRSFNNNNYLTCIKDKKKEFLHRLIVSAPKDMVVDHINNNRFDNRKTNLRITTQGHNLCNKPVRKTSKTGVKCVQKRGNRYIPNIFYKGKRIYCGCFERMEDAIKVARDKHIELWGENDSAIFPG